MARRRYGSNSLGWNPPERNRRKYYTDEFGWGEFLKIAEEGIHAKCWEDRFKLSADDGDNQQQGHDWYGNATLKEAVILARYGWHDGVNAVSAQRDHIESDVMQSVSRTLQEVFPDVQGSFPNIPALCTGDPESMWHIQNVEKEELGIDGKFVRIYTPLTVPYYVKKHELLKWGACIALMVDMLETMGVMVEVVGNHHVYPKTFKVSKMSGLKDRGPGLGSFNMLNINIRIKDYEQPLDMDRLSFALCNIAFIRRVYTAYFERFEVCEDAINNYGVPMAEVGPQTEPGVRLPSLTTFMGSYSSEMPPIGELFERIKRVYDERLDEALDRI